MWDDWHICHFAYCYMPNNYRRWFLNKLPFPKFLDSVNTCRQPNTLNKDHIYESVKNVTPPPTNFCKRFLMPMKNDFLVHFYFQFFFTLSTSTCMITKLDAAVASFTALTSKCWIGTSVFTKHSLISIITIIPEIKKK